MHHEVVDLTAHRGNEVFIRIVDLESGGWGHVNFDHFRLHPRRPPVKPIRTVETAFQQKTGYLPKEAAARMSVPDGFRVELVAGEPDLHQPIAFTIDEKGRLWVVEAWSYPVRRPEESRRKWR